MRTITILAALIGAALALAGCTTQESTNNTTTTTTPTTGGANNTTGNNTTGGTTNTTGGTTNTTGGSTNTTGGNATGGTNLTFVASQSGPPGNNTTYSFSGPSSAKAGWTRVELRNQGMEPHQASFLRLVNMTYEDFVAAFMGNGTEGNASMGQAIPAGGVNGIAPNGSGVAWVDLEPGTYVVVCFIPSAATGMPHAAHGMTHKLNVTASAPPAVQRPQADFVLRLRDYAFEPDQGAFTPPANLTAGAHVVEVRNVGNHSHEAQFVLLQEGKTGQDFLAWTQTLQGPPPATDLFGAASIGAGGTEFFEHNFTAGHYFVLCFEQDGPNDPPHFAKAMTWEFNVTAAS